MKMLQTQFVKMHLHILILIFVFLFQLILSSSGQSDDTPISTSQLAKDFEAKADLYADITPDKYGTLSHSQTDDMLSLYRMAGDLEGRPDSHEIMLKLLDKYNSHEGEAQTALWSSVPAKRPYTQADLPYLKQLFLLSFDFKQTPTEKPLRDPGFRLTPERTRFRLAFFISFINDPSTPENTITDESLFQTNSRAWVEKQIPNIATTPTAKTQAK